MATKKVWFKLLYKDGEEVVPNVTSVGVPRDACVDHFRKVAYKKVKTALPARVSVHRLKAFASRDAHQQQSALKMSAELGDFGQDADDPVVVQVPEVWVRLVDAESGAPFADTDPASIPLTEGDRVESLREIVVDAYRVILGDVSPYSLKFYANIKMQKPLHPEAQIGLLGGTLETAVIIKVPSVAGSPKRKRPSDDVDPKAAKHTKADVPISTVKENKFRQLFSNNQCIGGSFETQRTLTVEKFYRLLFPDDGSLGLPVISVRAPPMSGKTDMCCLLNNYIVANNPQVLVTHIAASYMLDSDTDKFMACFERQFGGTFTQFSSLSREKVVLIDEAEMAYRDAQLWAGIAKSVINGSIPRMRIVLFSSYGSFNNFICENRTRSGVDIRPEYRFGLRGTAVKPGLELTRKGTKGNGRWWHEGRSG